LKKKGFLLSRVGSIGIALEGIRSVLRNEPNTRVHGAFTAAVFVLAWFLRLDRWEWVCLVLTVGFVWVAEIFNTAVEVLVDLVSPEQNPSAKLIKDISAGAVLVSVFVSVAVGLILFGPPLWGWITTGGFK
jgi:diacylglycerol kinase (ATP)